MCGALVMALIIAIATISIGCDGDTTLIVVNESTSDVVVEIDGAPTFPGDPISAGSSTSIATESFHFPIHMRVINVDGSVLLSRTFTYAQVEAQDFTIVVN